MQPLQGKNRFLLALQPQGGASLTLGYYMQPPRGKNPNHRYSFAGRPFSELCRFAACGRKISSGIMHQLLRYASMRSDFCPKNFRCTPGGAKTIRFPNRTCKRYIFQRDRFWQFQGHAIQHTRSRDRMQKHYGQNLLKMPLISLLRRKTSCQVSIKLPSK